MNGELVLKPVESIESAFTDRRELLFDDTKITLEAGSLYSYTEAFTAYERFMIKGSFSYTGSGSFGLAFDYNGREDKYKLITFANDTLGVSFNEGTTPITQTTADTEPNTVYSFTYIQEGSVGIFYLDGIAALTVRLYGISGRSIYLFAENNTVEFTDLAEYTMG